MVLLGALMN